MWKKRLSGDWLRLTNRPSGEYNTPTDRGVVGGESRGPVNILAD